MKMKDVFVENFQIFKPLNAFGERNFSLHLKILTEIFASIQHFYSRFD